MEDEREWRLTFDVPLLGGGGTGAFVGGALRCTEGLWEGEWLAARSLFPLLTSSSSGPSVLRPIWNASLLRILAKLAGEFWLSTAVFSGGCGLVAGTSAGCVGALGFSFTAGADLEGGVATRGSGVLLVSSSGSCWESGVSLLAPPIPLKCEVGGVDTEGVVGAALETSTSSPIPRMKRRKCPEGRGGGGGGITS